MVQDIYGNEINPQPWPNLGVAAREYGNSTTAIFDLNDFSDDEKLTKKSLREAITGFALNTQPKKLKSLAISELQTFLSNLESRSAFIDGKLTDQTLDAAEKSQLRSQQQSVAQRIRALQGYIEFRVRGGLTDK